MSWRRWLVLLRGLSAQSVTAQALQSRRGHPREKVHTLKSPAEVQAYMASQFGPPPTTEAVD